ncbi:COX15/CtaA family [Hygrophoropsis aurantiaca]|uniref:COX15/CtaA family n=1 Tax=Hygrophoropsis aurantiaca TaxID=72124 RepID=A0ACB8AV20_9AGAM|nr:COX15/CtaA family [Hygrophoropsis aurantiaca]
MPSQSILFGGRTQNSSHASATVAPLPVLAPPAVGRWLLFSSALVFAVIVVGGVTRLTESGLSITEWKPITGIIPPLTLEDWNIEFEKYKATPEFKLLNHSITLDEFKNIFYMEWGHRVLGRVIGVAFVVPLTYFALRKKLTPSMPLKLFGMAVLLGAQGFLGWYMVKSGLEDSLMDTPGAVPRVSQYRLAAHLGTAVVLYAGMLGTGLAAIKDWKYARGGPWSGSKTMSWHDATSNPLVRKFTRRSWALTGLVFLTALSGAFVAGLDAGLLYNEFPLMGGRLAPPTSELFSPAYAKSADGSDIWWRNIFENPTTVQFDHRVLAMTTYFSTCLIYLQSRRAPLRTALPPLARVSVTAAFAMANVQVLLGLATLLYLVPVPVAAAHQAGSIALLSTMVHLLVALRRPGLAARLWRKAGVQAPKAKS